ncbi:hypothetical protein [Parasitella parasitica]|uniref:Uncharacterized protein n=1 Tax=Parasitella parasitica TaxID=35722 RepID=A0A0B7NHM3_9FUNG|nr:hypothetical protein [Parasitella parasitica]
MYANLSRALQSTKKDKKYGNIFEDGDQDDGHDGEVPDESKQIPRTAAYSPVICWEDQPDDILLFFEVVTEIQEQNSKLWGKNHEVYAADEYLHIPVKERNNS